MKKHCILFHRWWLTCLGLTAYLWVAAQTPEFPPVDTLPAPLDSLPDESVDAYATQLSAQTASIRAIYDQLAAAATLERETVEQQFNLVKADTTVAASDRKALEKRLKTAKSAEKSALKDADKARKAVEWVDKVAAMEPPDKRKNLPKARKTAVALLPKPVIVEPAEKPIAEVIGSVEVAPPGEPPSASPVAPADTLATAMAADSSATADSTSASGSKKNKKEKKAAPSGPKYKAYDPAADVMLHPPQRPCNLTVDTRDEFSGERHRELGKEELFRFTNPALKPYFQDRDHIRCEAALAANTGNYVLNLTLTIQDVNARRAFGSLQRNGVAILKYLDGETVTLYNERSDEGQADASNSVFTFRGQYILEPGMFKKMQKTYLDKIRIAWSTGYEDYDVQNVDLLARQMSCLLKN